MGKHTQTFQLQSSKLPLNFTQLWTEEVMMSAVLKEKYELYWKFYGFSPSKRARKNHR